MNRKNKYEEIQYESNLSKTTFETRYLLDKNTNDESGEGETKKS